MQRQNMRRGIKTDTAASLLVMTAYILLVLSKITKITERAGMGENKYLGVIILELVIFLLPAVIYAKLRGTDKMTRLRLRPIGAEALLLSFLAAGMLILGSLLINILFSRVSDGSFALYNTYRASHDGSAESFLYLSLAYAALPAVCEEFFFRSLLCAEYEKYGVLCAAVASSLFFAMIHFNFGQLVTYLFAGVVLALVMYASRSVIAPMCVHFVFNMYGLFGQGFLSEVYKTTGSTELFLLLLTAFFLLFAALFCGEAARLYRRYARQNKDSGYVGHADGKTQSGNQNRRNMTANASRHSIFETLLAPPCLVCYVIFVLVTALS